MRIILKITLLVLLTGSIELYAQTNVSGTINGAVWDSAGSPYRVTGNLDVQDLTIGPGVDVVFTGNFNLTVSGRLVATGTRTDSVRFVYDPGSSGFWQGISFEETAVEDTLRFVRISDASTAGLIIKNKVAYFEYCQISHNTGHGILFDGGKAFVIRSEIRNNGGNGLLVHAQGKSILKAVKLSSNSDKGLSLNNGKADLENVIIARNTQAGIGLETAADTLDFKNIVISDNQFVKAINAKDGVISGRNSVIYFNATVPITAGQAEIEFEYSDVQGGYSGTGNLSTDPLFSDREDYQLLTGSPCIDNGDPDDAYKDICFPPSSGEARNDMGAYGGPGACDWNDQLTTFPDSLDFSGITIGIPADSILNIQNCRNFPLSITNIQISGQDAANFSVDRTSLVIGPYEDFNLLIGFQPSEERSDYTADLRIFSSAGEYTVPLTGSGINAIYQISRTFIDFKSVSVTDSAREKIVIENNSDGIVRIDTLRFSDKHFYQKHLLPMYIPAGAGNIDSLYIYFRPDTILDYSGQVDFDDNHPLNIKINLIGTGKAPVIFSDTDTLAFPDTLVESEVSRPLVIRNEGTDTLFIDSLLIIPISPPGSDYFTVSGSSGSLVLAPRGEDTLNIKFHPTSHDTHSASLAIYNNDPFTKKNPYEIILTGTGVEPVAQIDPSDVIQFGAVITNTKAMQPVTIKNTGNIGLQIGPFALNQQGTENLPFEVNDYPADTNIAPLDSVTFNILFTPKQNNTDYAAVLKMPTNEIERDTVSINLSGNSVLPVLDKPDTVDFDAIAVKENKIKEISLRNVGTGILIIDTLYLDPSGDDAFILTVESFPMYLQPGTDSLNASIRFFPQAKGNFNSKIYISTNLPDALQLDSLIIQGTAQQPELQLSTKTLIFDTTLIREARTDSVFISNPGDGILTIDSVAFTDIRDSSDFKLSSPVGSLNFPIHIEPQEIDTLLVKFKPDSIEKTERRADLLIYSNDPELYPYPDTLSMKGIAKSPVTINNAGSIRFNTEFVDQNSIAFLRIGNLGEQDLQILSVEFDLTNNSPFSTAGETGLIIKPDSSDSLMIRFAPDTAGLFSDTLRIRSNDPVHETVAVGLTGTGKIDSSHANIVVKEFPDPLISDADNLIKIHISGTRAPVTWCGFFARLAARPDYESLAMNPALPGSLVTERGLEYYIDVRHGGSHTFLFDQDRPGHPIYAQATIMKLKYPAPTRKDEYQMISLPVESGGQTLDSLFGDVLGIYNDTQYRLFDYVDSVTNYVELTGLDRYLPRGKAFWLITRNSKELAVGNVKSPANLDTFSIPLKKGWNMIGVPFPFPVAKESIDLSMIGGSSFYAWQIEQWDSQVSILEPYSGYAVYALDNTTLRVPPVAAELKGAAKYAASQDHSAVWKINIGASRGRYLDPENIAGVLENALDGFDRYDMPEPPSPGNYVSVYFHNSRIPLTADFRAPSDSVSGYRFEFSVVSNFAGTTTLTVEDKNLPPDYQYAIVSDETGVRYDDPNSIRITVDRQDFILLVGSSDFIDRSAASYSTLPVNYTLYQNYPNPFNPETTIKYTLPAAAKTDLVIYDILGRVVRKLQSGELMEAGFHTVIWDGTNNRHEPVASGIYFLALRTPAYQHTIKMLLQR